MPAHVQPFYSSARMHPDPCHCDMDEGKTHEEVTHDKLVTRLARLRDDLVDWLKTVDEVPARPCVQEETGYNPGAAQRLPLESTKTPLTQSPCKCSIRHRLRCSAARQPRPTRCGRNERPMHQDCGLAGAQLSFSACNNTVDARHKSRDCRRWRDVTGLGHPSPREVSMEIHQICGDVFGSGPKKTVQKSAAARQDAEVTRLLDERARLLRVECKNGSLSSVASGLHAWHAFATDILGYSESETLPPQAGCGHLQVPGHSQKPWYSCQLRRVRQVGVHAPFHGDQLGGPRPSR